MGPATTVHGIFSIFLYQDGGVSKMYIELRGDKGLVQRKRASRPTRVSARLLAQPRGVDGDIHIKQACADGTGAAEDR